MLDAASFDTLLRRCFARSDALFNSLPEGALQARPIGLRHPFLFYLGHLPAFAWNQIGRGVLGEGALNQEFDCLFERGIDPCDETQAARQSISAWPSVDRVLAYRDRARAEVLARIPTVLARPQDVLCEHGRALHLVAEHELMHHETLMYMLQELPRSLPAPESLLMGVDGEGRAAQPVQVPEARVRVGVDFDALPFGWDNEFGNLEVQVPRFTIDSLPVRNRDWLDFLTGRSDAERARLWPQAWSFTTGSRQVKTVLGLVPFERAAGWPVQVSGVQARAYAAWRGGRLPTEAELRHAALGSPQGPRPYPWGDAPPQPQHGNFGFRRMSPGPVGSHPEGVSAWGAEELVGNGWEWTSTPFEPLPGFVAYARTYPGYSADFFDGEHDIVFGGSWATDESLLRPSFRNWYRRDYPYVFSSFRVVTPSTV